MTGATSQVPALGIKVGFDIAELVDRIYLGPSLSKAEIDAIRDAVSTHGLEDRIRVTSMLGIPRYT